MGVIQRQGSKRSLVAYATAVLGAVSATLIYPENYELYGKIRFILGVAVLLFPLVSLGVLSLPVRFFPEFNQGKGRNGFFGILLFWFFIASSLTLLLIYFNSSVLYRFLKWLNFNPETFKANAIPIIALLNLIGLTDLLKRYTSNFQRVVIPEILTSTLLKVCIPLLILTSVYFPTLSPDAGWILVGIYSIIVAGLLVYLYTLGGIELKVNWSFLTKRRVKTIFYYAIYGTIGSLGSVIAFNLDTVMVSGMIGLEENGQYTNALNFATFIAIPQVSIAAIAGPIISKHIKNNEWKQVGELYQQSSLNLGFIGMVVFSLLVLNFEYLASLVATPEKLLTLTVPIFILGFAKVFDMLSGLNREIMGYSNLYRINLVFVISLAILNIGLNYLLIPLFQIKGAALATMLSILTINSLRGITLYVSKSIIPLTINHLWSSLYIIALTIGLYILELPIHAVFNIGLKSTIFLALTIYGNYRFNWSPLLNKLLQNTPIIKSYFN